MKTRYPVTLIFIDEKENHKKALLQIGKEQYQDVICFEEYLEFENFMDNPNHSGLSILLFIHVFRLEGYKGKKYNSTWKLIKTEFRGLGIHWVTSDKAGATGDEINEPRNTYKYDEIPEFIEKGDLVPILISNSKNINVLNFDMNKNYIFLSHSSKDKDIVTSFFEKILRLGLNVSKDDIFFSSHPSTGITTGEDIPDSLKEALNRMTLFIQYVSEDYKSSEVCLNEMGAAWLKLSKNRIITIKSKGLKFSDLGFINVQRIGLCIDKKNDLLSITRDFKELFSFDPVDFNNKVDEFLIENGF
jgi:hypothetical protein